MFRFETVYMYQFYSQPQKMYCKYAFDIEGVIPNVILLLHDPFLEAAEQKKGAPIMVIWVVEFPWEVYTVCILRQ